ncbi:alpha/beta hydrolase [Lactiplantibacillus pentosus]|uniref:Alpha/beta hydrolase n=2 Tax=Lactiplantibacillus pentosus TaxID=1589 RepID=A0ABD7ISA2_LACPE|nr:alpha/beta hydrolase [Lactiplantibacillus pentosus]MCA1344066.1 alpha/beta hydrolase [Lactiplantibacillus pentosus]MCJ8185977.1 alpha/beta hydrolase [Lactiplantibacillus pentosus]MCT3303974.1 alpha/beta hydrolase [Lactiplantibacillus pentosus]MCT3310250.1 alpha/beta hydrolase [Lactiplantibacillus pentosus]PRO77955.1 alpha/beta hydrolase [Lactiplantibacillus pentosus]
MNSQTVVFMNKALNLRLAGILRLPNNFDLSQNYPALVVTGPMLSVKEQAQSIYASRLTELGYVTLVFDGAYFGESEGTPRQQELPEVKETDIEGAVDFLTSLPYVDNERISGLGICGSGSYMSVAGVKEPRLKSIVAIVPAISDISKSAMASFFLPEDQVTAAKAAYDKGEGELTHLNFMPRAFDEGAAYYYSARGTSPRWSNQVVAWSQLELVKYNVPNIMKDMKKPYLVITAENAWSKDASVEDFNAVPGDNKELHVIPEAGHFDMYDLAPYVSEAFDYIKPFLAKNL